MNVQQDSQGNDTRKLLQWHPVFFAGIQIELKDEADNLIFEQEHPLGTKPIMDIIVTSNKENFREVKDMCEALEELIQCCPAN